MGDDATVGARVVRARVVGVVSIVCVGSLLLGGCGPASPSPQADAATSCDYQNPTPLWGAASGVATSGPAPASPTPAVDKPPPRDVAEGLQRVEDALATTHSAALDLTTQGAGSPIEIAGAYVRDGDRLCADLTLLRTTPDGASLPVDREVMLGDVVFLEPPLRTVSPNWVRFSLDDVGAVNQPQLSRALDQLEQSYPAGYVRLLEASRDARDVGVEHIDGYDCTRYAGTVDLTSTRVDARSPYVTAELAAIAGVAGSTIDIDLCVDDEDLPVRIRASYGDAGSTVTTEIKFKYNLSWPIDPPPSADTMNLQQAMNDNGSPAAA